MNSIEKDITKDEKEEETIIDQHFPEKKPAYSELTKDEKSEPRLEKKFEDLAEEIKEEHKTTKRKIRLSRIIVPALVVLAIIFLIYLFIGTDDGISITVIKNNDCSFCTDVSPIIEEINGSKEVDIISFEELDYKDAKAKELIEKIQARTVPVIIIEGKAFTKTKFFKNISSENIEKNADKFILSNFIPPLTNIQNNQLLGVVDAIYVKDDACSECADLDYVIEKMRKLSVYIHDVRVIDINEEEGKEIRLLYHLEKVPILIFDQNLALYPQIRKDWESYGTIEKDGAMVMRKTLPPYKEVSTGKIKGLIKATFLTDKTCKECYDPQMHKNTISRIMPYYEEETTLDISDVKAQELIVRYNIDSIPTMILSKDVKEYPLFEALFSDAFEEQSDGSYVFKANDKLKSTTYKDLRQDKIIVN